MEQAQSFGPPGPEVAHHGGAAGQGGESLSGGGIGGGAFADNGEAAQSPKQPPPPLPAPSAGNQTTEHRGNHSHRTDPSKVSAAATASVATEEAKGSAFSSRTGSAAARHIRQRRRSISPRLNGDRKAARVVSHPAKMHESQQHRRSDLEQSQQQRNH